MELSSAASSLVLLSSSNLQRPSSDLLPNLLPPVLIRSSGQQGASPDLIQSTECQDSPEFLLEVNYQDMNPTQQSLSPDSKFESKFGSKFESKTQTQTQSQSPLFQLFQVETPESPGTSLSTSPVTPVFQTQHRSLSIRDETSCCIFCGGLIQINSGSIYNKRKRSMKSLGLFVTTRCQPTPYGYQYFSTAMGEERVLLCISCVNWQRRSSGAGRRKRGIARKPMLLMDQVALFMLEPGTTPFPDQRCVLRLVMSLKNVGGNFTDWVPKLLLGLMPVQVQTMIGMLPSQPTENVLNSIVRVWWDYNGRTVYFAHHLTAKLVRKMLKNNRSLDNIDEQEHA